MDEDYVDEDEDYVDEDEDYVDDLLIVLLETYGSEDNVLYYIYEVNVNENTINSAYIVTCFDRVVEKTCFTSLDLREALEFVRNKMDGEEKNVRKKQRR